MMNPLLLKDVSDYKAMREQILAAYPQIEDDLDLLLDTLEGETNLTDRIAWMVRQIDDDEIMISGIKDRMTALQARLVRIQQRLQAKKDMIVEALEDTDIPKITKPDFTLSLRSVPGTARVTEEDKLPDEYTTTVTTTKPNMRQINIALRAGKEIAGAVLSNSYRTLTIRRN